MTYRIFEVPEYHEFFDVLGTTPEPVNEYGAGCLTFKIDNETMEITFDVHGRSVNCRWLRDSAVLAEIFREGAVQLRLGSVGARNYIAIDFETDSEKGFLELQVFPAFRLRDQLLRQ